jgi:hypothetical protein
MAVIATNTAIKLNSNRFVKRGLGVDKGVFIVSLVYVGSMGVGVLLLFVFDIMYISSQK